MESLYKTAEKFPPEVWRVLTFVYDNDDDSYIATGLVQLSLSPVLKESTYFH